MTNPQITNIGEIKISIIGQVGSGKTTLIATIAKEISALHQFKVLPDHQLKVHINHLDHLIDQVNLEFEVKSWAGTSERKDYTLNINKEINENHETKEIIETKISLMDYLGGDTNHLLSRPDLNSIKQFILDSDVILIPIDAMVMMESTLKKYQPSVDQILGLSAIERIIEFLKKENKGNTTFIFVPLKCEIYFNDNGGLYDKSELLYQKTLEKYKNIRAQISNLPRSKVFYAPVDTMGAVDLVSVSWEKTSGTSSQEEYNPKALFRIKRDHPKHRKGMKHLIKIILRESLEKLRSEIKDDLNDLQFWQIFNKQELEYKINRIEMIVDDISDIPNDSRIREFIHV